MIKGNRIKRQLNLNISYFSTHVREVRASYTQKTDFLHPLGED